MNILKRAWRALFKQAPVQEEETPQPPKELGIEDGFYAGFKRTVDKVRFDQTGFFGNYSPFTGSYLPGTDAVAQFGRLKLGLATNGTNDIGYIAHEDFFTSTNYGWSQNASGNPSINMPTGGTTYLRTNGVAYAAFTLNDVEIYKDADAIFDLGKWKLGYDGNQADLAVLAHYDNMNVTDYALKQGSGGVTQVNSKTGQAVFFNVNNAEVGKIGTAGLTITQGVLLARANTDTTHELGRAKIGYDGTTTDVAVFAHYDKMNTTDFALSHSAAGATVLNASTAGGLAININDAAVFGVNAAGLIGTVTGGSAVNARITGFDDDDAMTANSATRGVTQQAIKAYVDTQVAGAGTWTYDADANLFGGTGAGANLTASQAQGNFLGGRDAGNDLTLGDNNVIIGDYAGQAITETSDNVIIGKWAHAGGVGGAKDVAVGYQALYYNSTGTGNIGIGYNAGLNNATGSNNISIGNEAGEGAGGNSRSAAINIGYQTGHALTTGGGIFIGYQAGLSVTSGTDNILIGDYAGDALTTHSESIAIGNYALSTATHSYSVAIGANAAQDVTTQTQPSVFIGFQAGMNLDSGAGGNVVIGSQAGLGVDGETIDYDDNVIIGNQAAFYNERGDNNVIVGKQAQYGKAGGTNNAGSGVIIGYQAGYKLDTGAGNVAIGSAPLYNNEAASYNIAIGYQTMYDLTAATDYNIAIGYYAAQYLETGTGRNILIGREAGQGNNTDAITYSNSTYIGAYAGEDSTTCEMNVALGNYALGDITSGSYNTGVGYYAGHYLKTGTWNVGIGYYATAGKSGGTLDGDGNIGIGHQALIDVDTCDHNIGIGYQAMYNNETSSGNIGIGYGALIDMTQQTSASVFIGYMSGRWVETGNGGNTCVGYETGKGHTSNAVTHSYNTLIGHKAGTVMETGIGNVCMGYQAGDAITSGDYNIIIGYDIDPASATGNNQFMLGSATYPFLKGDMSTYTLAINGSNGYLNFGTTLGSTGYGIRDNSGVMEFKDSGGSWTTFTSLINP